MQGSNKSPFKDAYYVLAFVQSRIKTEDIARLFPLALHVTDPIVYIQVQAKYGVPFGETEPRLTSACGMEAHFFALNYWRVVDGVVEVLKNKAPLTFPSGVWANGETAMNASPIGGHKLKFHYERGLTEREKAFLSPTKV